MIIQRRWRRRDLEAFEEDDKDQSLEGKDKDYDE